MDDNLVPVIGIIVIFGFPIGGWILGRILKHRERMAYLERGMVPPRDMRKYRKQGYGGSMGLGTPGMPGPNSPSGYGDYEMQSAAQYSLQRGVRTTMVGLALTIGFSFIGYHADQFPPIEPGPWLLGGLIPMFVGVAQIINAILAGASFTLRMPMPPSPPPPPGPPPPPRDPFRGFSEPGRPGPRYEELARPVPPPDLPKNT